VIPAYNEAGIIKRTIYDIHDYLKKNNYVFEIFVVLDGCTDNTLEVVAGCARELRSVRFCAYEKNIGKGYAVRRGLVMSEWNTKLVLDADHSIRIEELDNVSCFKAWCIYGVRTQIIRQPFYRIFVGKMWQLLVFIETGMFFDSQAPFKLLNMPRDFYVNLKIDGFAYDVELLYKIKKLGKKLIPLDVSYYNQLRSSVTPKKTWQMFKDLTNIRRER